MRPLRRAQSQLDAWVCGLRSGQGATRETVQPVEWDQSGGLLKVNPLAAWTEERCWEYIRANDVPYNPLHDAGYPSISAARGARARSCPEKTTVVAAGGGRTPNHASAACTSARAC